jgi:hypothetical protein
MEPESHKIAAKPTAAQGFLMYYPVGDRIMKKGRYIFVKWITRGGRRVYASQYGLRAFRIWVKD